MSDSDWEVLSSDDGAAPQRHSPTSATASDGAAGEDSGRRRAARDPFRRLNRNTILTPLCVTLNQTGTRIGVGHTTGFLVFRVVSAALPSNAQAAAAASAKSMPTPAYAEHGAAAATPSAADAMPSGLPAQSRLQLDPQYNLDLLTFTRIRERMRKEQEERHRIRHAQHALQPTSSHASPVTSTEADVASVETTSHTAARGPRADVGAPAASTPFADDGADIFSDEDDDSVDDFLDRGSALHAENDLGSFLTTAGRAFAQMKRSAATRPSANAATAAARTPAPEETASPSPAPEKSTASPVTPTATSAPATAHASIPAELHTAAAAPVITPAGSADPSYCARFIFAPSPVLEWGRDEDVDVDPPASLVAGTRTVEAPAAAPATDDEAPPEKREACAVAASVADPAPVPSMTVGSQPASSHVPRTPTASAERLLDAAPAAAAAAAVLAPGELDPDDDYLGFSGGGVAVMAFLYEQPWVALVGGGPTPMGPANVVELVRDGERQHTLATPDPIVRLFLDARLLFVLTTAELRLYTNPMEPSWTCLRQSLRLPAATASRYAGLLHASAASLAAPRAPAAEARLHVWEKPTAAPSTSHSRESAAGGVAAAPGATPLPVIPVVVDYARSLVMMPSGEEGTGFALHRYVSGPEVRHADPLADEAPSHSAGRLADAGGSVSGGVSGGSGGGVAAATGRTTAFLQHIATQAAAHRNPLFNLALFVGWPSAITRLIAANADEDAAATASTADSPSGDGGGLVTLVAASSEYATRLTLWMLQHARAAALRDEGAAAQRGSPADSVFVLLREFRVGVRLAAPRLVMATLPSVTRYIARGQAALGGAEGAPHAGIAAGAPSASASAFRFSGGASSTPSSASHMGTVTSWASEAAAAVAASTARPAVVQHLQFVGNGAYLLCICGADTISIFSTSARESEQEARNVCRDRVAAEQNRYSRLTVMKEYLPRALSNRLEAYTRQAWSSCSGRLPAADHTFLPRWIYVRGQDAISAAAAAAAVPSSAASPARTSPPQGPAASSLAGSPVPPPHAAGGGRRFLDRFTSLVAPRTAAAAPTADTSSEPTRLTGLREPAAGHDDDEVEPSISMPPVSAAPHRHATAGKAPSAEAVLLPQDRVPADSAVVWGTPLADLPQCIQVWSPPPHLAGNSRTAASASLTGAASARHPPIVLNCATCEGAFANILLFADEGELVASQALPYVAS